jgi:hypothetical protein
LTKFENQPNYNCTIITDTGEEYQVYANWIHNNNLDSWQGWSCDAGKTRFYIDKNFDVWSGECQNDYLGNAANEWSPKVDSICKRKTCFGCTDDLIVKKQRND